MELQPKRPPGRIDRKAARYAAEIARLRSAGYTYEAIREALADVGLAVSTSALRREVRRMRQRSPLQQRTPVPPGDALPSPASPAPVQPSSSASRPTPVQAAPLPRAPPASPTPPSAPGSRAAPVVEHTRAAAEAFFTANPSHLLHPHKETP
ncbi:hypothetical protein OOZ63_22520 [Paucibacter sp. PLA-PC-4]|uniref:hypothetical protein n=1 Tax=Paucibacter sp. PLA-PC-4 TaxID=2993655 RepID=UPI00224AD776|nr:hypothetical protein [Paucibacter sp. PLA-PC-4]MCX2864610.1 hypothetical protein [Paucibacter sp. PLA-PC-4]